MEHVPELVLGPLAAEKAKEVVGELVKRHAVAEEVHCTYEEVVFVLLSRRLIERILYRARFARR